MAARKKLEAKSILQRMLLAAQRGDQALSKDQERRILWAAEALDRGADNDEPQAMLTDVLTNLMHFAAYSKQYPTPDWEGTAQPVDFDEALRMARDHFDAEKDGGE